MCVCPLGCALFRLYLCAHRECRLQLVQRSMKPFGGAATMQHHAGSGCNNSASSSSPASSPSNDDSCSRCVRQRPPPSSSSSSSMARRNLIVCMATLFSLMFTKCYASQALEFTVEPSDVTIPEGNSVMLQCAGRADRKVLQDGKVAPNIRWRGPDGQDIGIVGDTFRSQLTNGSLYISSVESNRGLTGFYHCLLSVDGIGTIVSRSARVAIADLPDINQESHEIYLYAGQTAYFKCMSSLLPYSIESRYHTEWLKDDLPLRMDLTRMLLLPSGALEIDEVVPADRGTYQCNVTAGTFSRLSSKSNLNIKSTAGQPQSFAPPAFVIVPQPQTVREGDTVILDCAANGNPKPTIRWLRNGEDIDMNDLDSRFRIMGTGSLQINSIQDTDAGDYQCRASNTEDSLDASATVQVQVPPKFILSPDDKVAYEKEELELTCSIHGKPTPIIQWLKNGDLITPSEYMQIVGGHNLKIFGLIGSDAGMFQCIGTNPAGSVQAAARLEIIEPGLPKRHKGKKFQQTQSKTKSYEKSPLLLQSDPKLSKSVLDSLVSRTKARPKYTNDDYADHDRMLDSDHDGDDDDEDEDEDDEDEDEDDEEEEGKIYPLRPNEDPNKLYQTLTGSRSREDGGELVGHFSNPKSPLNAVTRKYSKSSYADGSGKFAAPLPGPPRTLQAQIVQSRFITLSWLEPAKNPDEVISYSVYYRMHTSDRERKMTTKSRDEQEINIQSLQPGKNYHFRVVGNSNHGPGESSETLEVRTLSEENIAGAPQNLRGYAITEKDIHLQWDPPAITNGMIAKYRVYYAETDNGMTEMYADTTTTEAILNELRPYTKYTMYVVPFNQAGMGDPSHEIDVKTYSSTPSEPPANVTLETTSSTSVAIRWEPPALEDRNGQITGYKIKYRKNKKPLQVETTPANVRYYILKELDKMSAYQVKIAAMTINGTGPFTEWHHIETYENDLDESQVPGQPAWLKTRPGADNITVTWGPPVHQEIKVRSYILGWGKGIPDEDTAEIEERMRYFEIPNLEPNSEYVISLRARNAMGDGAPKYDTVRTREDAPIEAPTPLEVPVGLRAIPMSGTSIVVYWTDTTLSKSQHVSDNRHYVVRYSPNGSNRYRYHNTSVLSSMIGDLRPNTQYEFAVKVVKGHRQSAWSMSVLNSTQPASPVSPPRDLQVTFDPRNPLTALLSWLSPRHVSGPIAGYQVLYTTDNTKRDRDWNIESTTGEHTSAEILHLEPHTTYYFKVQTRHSKGLGPFSAMVSLKTGAELDSSGNLTLDRSFSMELIYVTTGFAILGCLVIIGISVMKCRSKGPEGTPEHAKKSYQKNNAGIIKPPDLWIHHDQMELKNMDKGGNHGTTPGSVDGGASSSGTMTLPRSVGGGHDYDSETPITHVTNSLDKRSYVPGYNGNTTSLSSTMERPQYPRTQYSMAARPHIAMEQQTLSQQNLLQQPPQLPPANPLAQTPENPYTYDSSYSPNVTYAQGIAVDAPKRGQGHPLKSFSVPAPPASTPIISGQGKHGTPTPAVTIRPQNSSPYKKPSLSSGSLTNRLQSGPVVAHSNDEIQRLAPSTSTEELNQEMANLEGLMKDLSAITANEFEC